MRFKQFLMLEHPGDWRAEWLLSSPTITLKNGDKVSINVQLNWRRAEPFEVEVEARDEGGPGRTTTFFNSPVEQARVEKWDDSDTKYMDKLVSDITKALEELPNPSMNAQDVFAKMMEDGLKKLIGKHQLSDMIDPDAPGANELHDKLKGRK